MADTEGDDRDNPFAALPRTDDLLAATSSLVVLHGQQRVRDAIRSSLDAARVRIADGAAAPSAEDLVGEVTAGLGPRRRGGPRRVVNAAGVLVHTNLGRAPLSPAAVTAIIEASGYCDLEIDLDTGRRGGRGAHCDAMLAEAVGAEDAMVVNNCAAALVLSLMAIAAGRTVLVSRGHLVEIGGAFRLPDIMATSGARLREVGTTNRTRLGDYEGGEDVAALLTVHPSNFTQAGFVAQPPLAAVADVAHAMGVPLVHDAGSGLLTPSTLGPLRDEPSMAGAIGAGADLVLASGDKLLGGPQAGLIAGSADLVDRCRRHPLARALRLDKLRLAALSATLLAHLRGEEGTVRGRLHAEPELDARAAALATALDGHVVGAVTVIGGGSAPGVGVDSPAVVLPDRHPTAVSAALRQHDPPVLARVTDGAVHLDLRTVDPADDAIVLAAVRAARAAAG